MNEKLVSVIIPIFNAEKYIKECINSVLNQSYKNLEIICINDGSRDKSLEILEKFNDSRIKIINKNNEGVSVARNEGILLAKGKYVVFVDVDDCLVNSSIEKLVNKISESESTDMVIGNYHIINTERNGSVKINKEIEPSKIINKVFNKLYDDGIDALGNVRTVWGKIYKRDIIINNNIKFYKNVKLFEDGIFNIEYLTKSNSVFVTGDVVYNYRITEDSAVHKYYKDKYIQDVEKIEIIKEISERGQIDKESIKLFIFELYVEYLKNIRKCGNFSFLDIKERKLVYHKYLHKLKYKYLSKKHKFIYILYSFKFNIILYFILKIK